MTMHKKNNEEIKKSPLLEMMKGLQALGVPFEYDIQYNGKTYRSANYRQPPKPKYEAFPKQAWFGRVTDKTKGKHGKR